MSELAALEALLKEHTDLEAAASVLRWDQATFMPPGGAGARGRQLALLDGLVHDRISDPQIGQLVDRLDPSLPLVRVARREHERAVKIPRAFVSELAAHRAETYDVWTRAKPANDFAAIRPLLERGVELSRRYSAFLAPWEHVADPLIDILDPGMRVSMIRTLFAQLRAGLVPLVQAISAAPPADDRCLRQRFDEQQQLAFARSVASQLGYDFSRGRQDQSPHPFQTKFGVDDVRITTRVRPDHFSPGFFSTLHEAGHAIYEQNIGRALDGTLLANAASEGLHESQSRLWENLVGRSRAFWTGLYPRLQQAFAAQLGAVPLETFYRAINKVERGVIRINADEVTYGLHIILRFDFELELLEGKLKVRDLPEAWRERVRSDFGLAPETDTEGVLQDVHWYNSLFGGAFQCYALGNLMSAQLFDAALAAHPQISAELERGQFDPLRGWLVRHVHQPGRTMLASELLERATGSPLQIEPYLKYLRTKYGELYPL